MFRTLFTYAQLPEMRLFWIFLPFLIVLLGINVVYLPSEWVLPAFAAFVILGVLVFINNLRLARSNLEIKVERNESQSIIANLRDAVIAYDEHFRILIFNRAAEGIFGLRREMVIGQVFTLDHARKVEFKTLTQVIFPSLAPLVVRHSAQGVYPQVVDLSFTDPNLELRVTTDRIVDPAGQLLGFVRIAHDRTREVALLRSKTEFITVAAHQLRTPSTAVNWSLESLVKISLPDSAAEFAQTGFAASTKLLKIVNDLLDVSRIEEGRFGYQFEEVDIVEFLKKSIADMAGIAKQHSVKLFFEPPKESIATLSLDPQKFSMVIFNLLDNAIKYNIQNGQVVVGVARVPDQPFLQISIKDTGVGIPSRDMNKLFTKFFRAENAVRASTEGTGLGLYIVRNIVKRHGGDIWAESEFNRGSAFYVTLPTDPTLVPSKEVVYGEE